MWFWGFLLERLGGTGIIYHQDYGWSFERWWIQFWSCRSWCTRGSPRERVPGDSWLYGSNAQFPPFRNVPRREPLRWQIWKDGVSHETRAQERAGPWEAQTGSRIWDELERVRLEQEDQVGSSCKNLEEEIVSQIEWWQWNRKKVTWESRMAQITRTWLCARGRRKRPAGVFILKFQCHGMTGPLSCSFSGSCFRNQAKCQK